MKRIVITGAESTGKTTLTEALAGYYGEPWTPEYVRQYVDGLDHTLSSDDLEPIARGQLAQEDSGAVRANRFVLHDTNILSSIIYANHYFGEAIDWVNDAFLARDYSLYLLSSPDGIEWQADPGQRESPAARTELHLKFKQSLDRLQLPYIELSGALTARFGEAIRAIDGILQS